MKKFIMIGIIGMALALNGCTAVLSSRLHDLKIETEPADTTITVNGNPYTGKVASWRGSNENKIVVEKSGYMKCERQTTLGNQPLGMLDAFLGGLTFPIGFAFFFGVDYGTGAVFKPNENYIKFVMYPDETCDIFIQCDMGCGQNGDWKIQSGKITNKEEWKK